MRGAYCLLINVENTMRVKVGSLETIPLEAGRYIYVGSAMNGIEPRVRRHLNTAKKKFRSIHWHIDHLLKEPGANIDAVYKLPSETRIECAIASAISKRHVPVPGFGCTDCKCRSHLFKIKDRDPPDPGLILKELAELNLERSVVIENTNI